METSDSILEMQIYCIDIETYMPRGKRDTAC